jgi:hypothetical protein
MARTGRCMLTDAKLIARLSLFHSPADVAEETTWGDVDVSIPGLA